MTLLALILRFQGINFGLPYAESRPDEMTLTGKALGYGTGDFNPHFFNYPSLFSYVLLLAYGVYIVFLVVLEAGHSLQEVMLRLAGDPSPLLVISRCLSALAGAATVPVLFLLCRQVFSRWTAFAASMFLSVAYLHVRESHFGVTDALMTAFVAATVLFLMRIMKSGDRRDYLVAGVLAGLAASTKYNAVLLAVPAVVAHCLSPPRAGVSGSRRLADAKLWLMGVCMVAAFLVTSPFVLLDGGAFLRDFLFEVRHLAGEGETAMDRGWIHHFKMSLWHGTSPLWLIAAGAGAVGASVKNRRAAAVLLCFPLLYYAAMGRGYTVFARYIVPVVPFVCLFAGAAIGEVFHPWMNRLTGRSVAALASAALTAVLLATPLCRSLAWDRLLCQEDTRAQAVQFTEAHLPNGARLGWVGTRYGYPRFPETPESLGRQLERARRERGGGRLLAASQEVARRRGTGYNVAKLDVASLRAREDLPPHIWVEYYPLAYSLKAAAGAEDVLAARGFRRVVEFSGASRDVLAGPAVKYDFQDSLYAPFAGFEGVQRLGPTLTLWTREEGPAGYAVPVR